MSPTTFLSDGHSVGFIHNDTHAINFWVEGTEGKGEI